MTSKLEFWWAEAHKLWSLTTLADVRTIPSTACPLFVSKLNGDEHNTWNTIADIPDGGLQMQHKLSKQKLRQIPGIVLTAGWPFWWTSLSSCCSLWQCDSTVGIVQKVFSSPGSAKANVFRSAAVESKLVSWLLQRAAWAASSISSVVSSGLRRERTNFSVWNKFKHLNAAAVIYRFSPWLF